MAASILEEALPELLARLAAAPTSVRRVKMAVELCDGRWISVGQEMSEVAHVAKEQKVAQAPAAACKPSALPAAGDAAGASARPARLSATRARRQRRKVAAAHKSVAARQATLAPGGADGRSSGLPPLDGSMSDDCSAVVNELDDRELLAAWAAQSGDPVLSREAAATLRQIEKGDGAGTVSSSPSANPPLALQPPPPPPSLLRPANTSGQERAEKRNEPASAAQDAPAAKGCRSSASFDPSSSEADDEVLVSVVEFERLQREAGKAAGYLKGLERYKRKYDAARSRSREEPAPVQLGEPRSGRSSERACEC